ncbi:hypothetical protein EM61_020260 [Vibrio parahaemolyticus]|uniref:hypothetical protein n=1 Tax=Vibrio parahaemolyticus TaxID=670 RepID=UPI0004A25165|nr:hypothetical protein [Vibrio parahaemolyticus]ELN6894059.1 hypothetical protein [Vibrio cholerae]EIK4811105.1 hypothetical protein [Vibrio parahaemolyticus]EKC5524112.1 hypothetical protein [Vibrio parahaemolyticus]KKC79444.1 hypothetical protein WR32_00085 [Vibrio parahaemolyticus]KKX76968.1 hypothetical protein UF35_08510 [Vibrio parahaemolyticus]
MGTISFLDYVESRYGRGHGNRKLFLKDNPHIKASELSRWITGGYKVDLKSGDIFKPSNKKVNIKPTTI